MTDQSANGSDKSSVFAAAGLPERAITGFSVFMGEDGIWHFTPEMTLAAAIDYQRFPASNGDVMNAGLALSVDNLMQLLITNTVQNTVTNVMNNIAMAAARQQEAQATFQALKAQGLVDDRGRPIEPKGR